MSSRAPRDDKQSLLHLYVPVSLHRRLRIAAAQQSKTIKAVVADVLDGALPAAPAEGDK